jgi:hypothetical protein
VSNTARDLALRREVLVARSAVERLEVACEAQALHAALFRPRTAIALAAPPLVALLLGFARRGRFVRGAILAIAMLRVAQAFVRRR